MRKRFVWIAAAGLLGLTCEASATVATAKPHPQTANRQQDHARFQRDLHYRSAAARPADPFAASSSEECQAPEPSKLGLLRSTPAAGKTKSLCRKLRT